MIPLDIMPTGWFQIGLSGEIPPGGVKPMKYFGEDLVAFRSLNGRLSVLDAHCHHLGAHLGYGGKVKGDCVVCPYHGWEWNGEGENTLIPYQDKPINKRLKKWHTQERHGIIFAWYDPQGGSPRWELPDLFKDFPGFEASEEEFYPCYPNAVVDKPNEAFHVQLMLENAADCAHFRYTHGSPETPDVLSFRAEGQRYYTTMGFKSAKTKEVKLKLHIIAAGIGLVFNIFDGRSQYRLILSGTPVDNDHVHLRVNHFYRKEHGGTGEMPAGLLADMHQKDAIFEQDALIWRHQKFVQRPVFAAQDVEAYTTLRSWCAQFYEGQPGGNPLRAVS